MGTLAKPQSIHSCLKRSFFRSQNASFHSWMHDSTSQIQVTRGLCSVVLYTSQKQVFLSSFLLYVLEKTESSTNDLKDKTQYSEQVFSFSRRIYISSLIRAEKIIQWDLNDSFGESSLLVSHWESNTGVQKVWITVTDGTEVLCNG